jgi:DNA-binding TFAR19-related protein (PDSD5 family)
MDCCGRSSVTDRHTVCASLQKLRITAEQVENLLIQLILDGEVVGVIDQVKGILDLNQR